MAIFRGGRYPGEYQHSLFAVYVVAAMLFIVFAAMHYRQDILRVWRGDKFKPTYENGFLLNARPKTIYEEEKVLEIVATELSDQITLPKDIILTFTECEKGEGFYDREKLKVGLCYSKLSEISDGIEKRSSKEDLATRQEAKIQVAKFFLYKEIGKALIDVLNLPVNAREAEAFAIWFFIRKSQGDELLYTSRYYYPVDGKGDMQKFYSINCLIYGSDSRSYQYLEKGGKRLPPKYSENCSGEFQSLNQRWNSLLRPYLKR